MRQRDRVAVIGAGTMGWQISLILAAHGTPVSLYDRDDAALARALSTIAGQAPDLVASGAIPGPAHDTLARISPSETLAAAVATAWLVVEAIPERLDLKRSLFAELSAEAPREVILATNSSSFKSRLLADVTTHPQRLMNAHFYGNPWRRSGVELMSCGATDPSHLERVARFLRGCGLMPVIVRGESTGFVVNRIWRAVKRESLRVVAEGLATPEEVDRLWCLAMETPMGPFAMMDRVGLDVVQDIERHYAAESGRADDEPPAFLDDMVREGRLGQKTGSGFYEYPNPAYLRPGWPRDVDD